MSELFAFAKAMLAALVISYAMLGFAVWMVAVLEKHQ
jgi:hypothetical protein